MRFKRKNTIFGIDSGHACKLKEYSEKVSKHVLE